MKAALMTVLALFAGPGVWAGIFALTTLTQAVDGAAVIVIGDVTASPAGAPSSSTVQVVRVLKGNLDETALAFRWPHRIFGLTATSRHALLFLAADGPDGWVAVPATGGGNVYADYLLAVPLGDLRAEYSYAPDSAPLDKVVAELRYAIAANSDADADDLAGDYSALLSLQGKGENSAAPRVGTLSLQAAAACPTALALQTTGASLARTIRNRLAARLPVPSSLTALLCLTVDPCAASPAADVLNSVGADLLTRQCAAKSLRDSHSTTALPALAAVLDDPDMDIAYTAVMGLAEYAIGKLRGGTGPERSLTAADLATFRHSPSISAFEENPASYIAYWHRWWKCEACALEAPGCDQTACDGSAARAPLPGKSRRATARR